jgi:hypothetical protein
MRTAWATLLVGLIACDAPTNLLPDGGIATNGFGQIAPGPLPQSGIGCVVDTHSTMRTDGRLIESLTSNGRLYNFEINGAAWQGNGADVATVAHYAAGPCAGIPAGSCRFDTRAFVNVNGTVLEYITAYGKNWTWNNTIPTDAASDLATSPRYAEACAGRGIGVCTFDTRVFLYDQNQIVESITAYGRIFEITFAGPNGDSPTARNGQDLTTIPQYASGPCQGRAAGSCLFDGRTYLELNGQIVEEVTAYGMVWRLASNGTVIQAGTPLNTLAPWNQGLCR